MDYQNADKLNRAKAWAKEQGKEDDEATIKARYIALGGLIIGDTEAEVETEDKPKSKKAKADAE